jgi:hypothetical protein
LSVPTSPTGRRIHTADDLPAPVAEVENGVPCALSLREHVSAAPATVLGITLAVFGMFLPAVIVPYAFSDDYSILWMAVSGEPSAQFGKNILDANAVGGRPFAGLLSTWFFSAAGAIDNLRFVRLLAVLTIVALALLLHWAMVRSAVRPIPAALIAVLITSMPAFQVYASWTVLFSVPLAALLAGCASMLVVAAIGGARSLVVDRLLGATAILFAALLIYQPPAMFFWVFLAVALVGARHDSEQAFRLVRAHFGVGVVALALAFVMTKVIAHYLRDTAPGGARTHLTHDVVGKTRWFLEHPLYRSLNLFDLTTARWVAALVAIVATGGVLLWLLRFATRPLLYVVVAVILIPLSYLPNLVVPDRWPPFRTQVSLSSLIVLYACLGAIGIWLTLRDWLQPRVSRQALKAAERAALAVSVVFVGSSAFFAVKNVTTLIAEPQMTELRLLRSQVLALPAGTPRIAFVQTDWYGGATKLVVYDEFGLPSSHRPWALEPAVDLILREEGRFPPNGVRPIVDVYPSYTTTFPAGEPVVDLRGELPQRR